MSFSQNHIDVRVKDSVDNTVWRFTRFYGHPEEYNKHLSWNLLASLSRLCTALVIQR